MRAVSINRGMVMRAWYDYDMVDPNLGLHENMASLQESQLAIESLIVREEQRGIQPGHIVLAGFSQGGALALHGGPALSRKTRRNHGAVRLFASAANSRIGS